MLVGIVEGWGIHSEGRADRTTLIINTNLFDDASGTVDYTAESKSFDPSSREVVIHELTALLEAA